MGEYQKQDFFEEITWNTVILGEKKTHQLGHFWTTYATKVMYFIYDLALIKLWMRFIWLSCSLHVCDLFPKIFVRASTLSSPLNFILKTYPSPKLQNVPTELFPHISQRWTHHQPCPMIIKIMKRDEVNPHENKLLKWSSHNSLKCPDMPCAHFQPHTSSWPRLYLWKIWSDVIWLRRGSGNLAVSSVSYFQNTGGRGCQLSLQSDNWPAPKICNYSTS